MAGLQQYNFFPTDFFYPRPQPSIASKPTVFPLQTPKGDSDDQPQNQQQQPTSMIKVPPSTPALVYAQKKQSISGIDKNMSKFVADPLSLVVCTDDEEGSVEF